MESLHTSQISKTCLFSKTAGIRESRKFFSLVGNCNSSSSSGSVEELESLLGDMS